MEFLRFYLLKRRKSFSWKTEPVYNGEIYHGHKAKNVMVPKKGKLTIIPDKTEICLIPVPIDSGHTGFKV